MCDPSHNWPNGIGPIWQDFSIDPTINIVYYNQAPPLNPSFAAISAYNSTPYGALNGVSDVQSTTDSHGVTTTNFIDSQGHVMMQITTNPLGQVVSSTSFENGIETVVVTASATDASAAFYAMANSGAVMGEIIDTTPTGICISAVAANATTVTNNSTNPHASLAAARLAGLLTALRQYLASHSESDVISFSGGMTTVGEVLKILNTTTYNLVDTTYGRGAGENVTVKDINQVVTGYVVNMNAETAYGYTLSDQTGLGIILHEVGHDSYFGKYYESLLWTDFLAHGGDPNSLQAWQGTGINDWYLAEQNANMIGQAIANYLNMPTVPVMPTLQQ